MTTSDAHLDALGGQYGDLSEIERRAEGVWYAGTYSGERVVVVVLDAALAVMVSSQDRFTDTLARAAYIHEHALSLPITFGRTPAGQLHCAYRHSNLQRLLPGSHTAGDVAVLGA